MNRHCSEPWQAFSGGRPSTVLWVLVVLSGLFSAVPSAAEAPFAWQTAAPESQGMSKERLDALKDELAQRKTRAFLVLRNDQIIYAANGDIRGCLRR